MQIDVSLLVSVFALAVTAVVGISGLRRNRTHDDRQQAAELTTLIVKIENINNGINEIKSDMRYMRADINDLNKRLIIVEQSTKSAHHRIDTMSKEE